MSFWDRGRGTVDRLTSHFGSDEATGSTITHEAWNGSDGYGQPTYATGVSLPAVFVEKAESVRNRAGEEVVARGYLQILQAVAAEGTAGRDEPIDPRDRITLPDSEIAKIAAVEGIVDPSTGLHYAPKVWLA